MNKSHFWDTPRTVEVIHLFFGQDPFANLFFSNTSCFAQKMQIAKYSNFLVCSDCQLSSIMCQMERDLIQRVQAADSYLDVVVAVPPTWKVHEIHPSKKKNLLHKILKKTRKLLTPLCVSTQIYVLVGCVYTGMGGIFTYLPGPRTVTRNL